MSIPENDLEKQYKRQILYRFIFKSVYLLLLIQFTLFALTHGSASSITTEMAVKAFVSPSSVPGMLKTIIWEIRLPRICAALLAGAGLGLAGAVMQGILRNPLASPFTLGISSAAGFGASLAIVLGVGLVGTGRYLIVGNAFLFALAAFILVFFLARLRGLSAETLILSGIAVMYLFSSLTSLLQFLATSDQLSAVVFWMMGSLSGSSWLQVSLMAAVFLVSYPLLLGRAWDLNALASGRDSAHTLGVRVNRTMIICMVLSALLTASIISFTGVIGFIGLVAPHIVRIIAGGDHRHLIHLSTLTGALLLLVADTFSRILIPPSEIPLGILTSFIGVPFFIIILLSRRGVHKS